MVQISLQNVSRSFGSEVIFSDVTAKIEDHDRKGRFCPMMIDTPCARSQCPEMPKVSLDQAVVDLMESIALQETALSHILCAESRKMQKAMDLDGLDLCKLLEVNDSATNMVHAVANLELVLKDKLEFVSNNLYVPGDSGCPSPAQ